MILRAFGGFGTYLSVSGMFGFVAGGFPRPPALPQLYGVQRFATAQLLFGSAGVGVTGVWAATYGYKISPPLLATYTPHF